MSTKRKYSVVTIPDKKAETFSPSSCSCQKCKLMHISQLEWNSFIPETNLQKQMMTVIETIESRIKNNKKTNLNDIPKRLKTNKKQKNCKS
jgi:hypothetical protein